ncbi:MAG TPA: RES family NAD+ phosphorylase [Candidatus Limnocylindrales bacterium]|nr:RES family NAD+ phosphorylase [Candidatus Limnocylindrales bacterium]
MGEKGHPLTFVRNDGAARYRYDDPASEFQTWYGSRTSEGAFYEVYAGWTEGDHEPTVISELQRRRRVSGRVAIDDDLELIDLRGPAVNGVFRGLDDRLGTAEEYSLTQRWARRIFECAPRVGGVVYRSRLGGESGPNVAVFLPRGAAALQPLEPGDSVDAPRFAPERAALRAIGIGW